MQLYNNINIIFKQILTLNFRNFLKLKQFLCPFVYQKLSCNRDMVFLICQSRHQVMHCLNWKSITKGSREFSHWSYLLYNTYCDLSRQIVRYGVEQMSKNNPLIRQIRLYISSESCQCIRTVRLQVLHHRKKGTQKYELRVFNLSTTRKTKSMQRLKQVNRIIKRK